MVQAKTALAISKVLTHPDLNGYQFEFVPQVLRCFVCFIS